jgi:N-methylhydantoinase A
MLSSESYRVAIDIGGTFTDIVLIGSDGSVSTKKVSSTPDDYGRGIILALQEIFKETGVAPLTIEGVAHATTVATNAILEGKGTKTALITTKGFRDVLEIRRLRVPKLYALDYQRPAPLVPRNWRFEVEERMGPAGEPWMPLNESNVKDIAVKIRDEGIEAVAICLLHSYINPDHERRVAEIVRGILGAKVYVTCSYEILPEIREYERTSTTVVNAYLGPIIEHYVGSLESKLHEIGVKAPLHIMQSNGGMIGANSAIKKPAYTVESGPAAGVIAAARVAKMIGHSDIISLDMGGTTAKAALIEGGEPVKTTEYEVGAGINLSSKLVKGAGYAVKLPFIDLSEIGAGGGSIAYLDKGGLLHVGPQSAGAVPGPVCYDLGGEQPTVTDVLVALGYINPKYLVGGALRLNAEKSRHVLDEKLAKPLGKPLLETAYGTWLVAASTMTRAVKAVSTYRGRDPRDFALFAFGGNGPIAAAEIARQLEMKLVLVPPHPGVFSAIGLLFSDIEHELLQGFYRKVEKLIPAELEAAYAKLEDKAREEMKEEGFSADQIVLSRLADMRYCGQAYELTVPVERGNGVPDFSKIVDAFVAEHEKTYGHSVKNDPVEFMNVKVVVRAVPSKPKTSLGLLDASSGYQLKEAAKRMAYFGPSFGILETPVLARHDLLNRSVKGPLIVEEYDATCVIPPACEATVDKFGNIEIRLEG